MDERVSNGVMWANPRDAVYVAGATVKERAANVAGSGAAGLAQVRPSTPSTLLPTTLGNIHLTLGNNQSTLGNIQPLKWSIKANSPGPS
jgi:hypothetical protein